MKGRAFLQVARSDVAGPGEAFWRAAAVHSYYALVLECRDALLRWGATIPPRHNVHAATRLKMLYAGDADLKQLGRVLEKLVWLRNHASYDLRASATFSSDSKAHEAIREASDLDAIENDS